MVEKKPPGVGDDRVRPILDASGFNDPEHYFNFGAEPPLSARQRALLEPRSSKTAEEVRAEQEEADQRRAEQERMLREVADAADLERRHREFVDKLAMMLWAEYGPVERRMNYERDGGPSAEQRLDDRARACVSEAERLWRIRNE